MAKWRSLTGTRVNMLTVIGEDVRGEKSVLCRCDCGVERMIRRQKIHSGQLSCGCMGGRGHKPTHGMSNSPEYQVWSGMRARCSPSNKAERNQFYAGRGIAVCERWSGRDGFVNFLSDMGPRPPGMTLDRVDPNGNYEPSNCRWADQVTQMSNRRGDRRYVQRHLDEVIGTIASADVLLRRDDVLEALRALRATLIGESS